LTSNVEEHQEVTKREIILKTCKGWLPKVEIIKYY